MKNFIQSGLIYQYSKVNQRGAQAKMAKDLKLDKSTISKWMKRLQAEKLIFIEKYRGRNFAIIGFLDGEDEIYFYDLPEEDRNLP